MTNIIIGVALGSPCLGGGISGPFPPPPGWIWDFVFDGTEQVFDGGEPEIDLVRIF